MPDISPNQKIIVHKVTFNRDGGRLIIDSDTGSNYLNYLDTPTRVSIYNLGIASRTARYRTISHLSGKYDVIIDANTGPFAPTHTLYFHQPGPDERSIYRADIDPDCSNPVRFCNNVLSDIFGKIPKTIYIRRIS